MCVLHVLSFLHVLLQAIEFSAGNAEWTEGRDQQPTASGERAHLSRAELLTGLEV